MPERHEYDAYRDFSTSRTQLAEALAEQVLSTVGPWVRGPEGELDVLDAGSGYGGTAVALSLRCRSVVACEPADALYSAAVASLATCRHGQVEFRHHGIEALASRNDFDIAVLDNVYEHLSEQQSSLAAVWAALRPGGVLYLLVPNKLWPIEAHYRLPLLSWVPLRWADRYLRLTGRGHSYADASYAPTYWSLKRNLDRQGFEVHFVLPGSVPATVAGMPRHYRLGLLLLDRFPSLWCISKALLVVATKSQSSPREKADSRSWRE